MLTIEKHMVTVDHTSGEVTLNIVAKLECHCGHVGLKEVCIPCRPVVVFKCLGCEDENRVEIIISG